MSKIIDWYPDAPNTLLWRNHDLNVKREFYPSVSIRFEDMPEWHECETRYKEGYDLLWSLRQEPHTEEELAELQAQYDAWKASNPDLAEEIDASVPLIDNAVPSKPEPEQEESAES